MTMLTIAHLGAILSGIHLCTVINIYNPLLIAFSDLLDRKTAETLLFVLVVLAVVFVTVYVRKEDLAKTKDLPKTKN
jgi:hypothetical protein